MRLIFYCVVNVIVLCTMLNAFNFQLAQGLDRGKPNRASSVLVWDVIRETGSRQQFDANTNSEFSSGLPADSLYNIDKFIGDIYIKDRRMQSFCDRPLCDACILGFSVTSLYLFLLCFASLTLNIFVLYLRPK